MKWAQNYINSVPNIFLKTTAKGIYFGLLPVKYIFQHEQSVKELNKRPDPYFSGYVPEDVPQVYSNFKEEILTKGTFWPFMISPYDFEHPKMIANYKEQWTDVDAFGNKLQRKWFKFIVREGHHRIKTYHELVKEGRITEDFLVPVVISMTGYPFFSNLGIDEPLITKAIDTHSNYREFWEEFRSTVHKVQDITVNDKSILPTDLLNKPGFLPELDYYKLIR